MLIKKREQLDLDLADGVTVGRCADYFKMLVEDYGEFAEVELSLDWDGDSRIFIEYEREETVQEEFKRLNDKEKERVRDETNEVNEYRRLKAKFESPGTHTGRTSCR